MIQINRINSLILLFFCALFSIATTANSPSGCQLLQGKQVDNATVLIAEHIPAGPYTALNKQTYTVPAFCRIRASVNTSDTSTVFFETWLPLHDWTGRYHQFDAGGFWDSISYSGLAWRLEKGDAVTEVDSVGDWRDTVATTDDPFAFMRDPEKVLDLVRGHRAAAQHAKAIATLFYQRAPEYSYFTGCSGGGYSALIEAQRNPEAWDGILAGAPAHNYLHLLFGRSYLAGLGESEAGRIHPEKLPAIQQAALRSCSDKAYVIDGVAADPRHCRLNPELMLCQGAETDSCLTAPQIASLKQIYQGARYRDGNKVNFGYSSTIEAERSLWLLDGSLNPTGWEGAVTGGKTTTVPQYRSFTSGYQNLVLQGRPWSVEQFDFDRDFPRALTHSVAGQPLVSLLEATDPDLSRFKRRDGKLMIYHGWGDPNIPAEGAIEYVEQVSRRMGAGQLPDFMRLYMVPGLLHCIGGPGANAFGQYPLTQGGKHYVSKPLKGDARHDIVKALETWVEEGVPPSSLTAVKYTDDAEPEKGVKMTRPLCVYPAIPVYNGNGNISQAGSFDCTVTGPKDRP